MTTAYLPPNATMEPFDAHAVDEAQLAAMSFLARYSGRTLEAYPYDMRCFFQWAVDTSLKVLDATRGHIEVYRCWLEDRGLAPSTVDRRPSRGPGPATPRRPTARPAHRAPRTAHRAPRTDGSRRLESEPGSTRCIPT